MVPLLWKIVWQILKKLSIKILYNPEIPSAIAKRIENVSTQKFLHECF